MVKRWSRSPPQDFRFTAKFLKIITYDKRLGDEYDIDNNLENDQQYSFKAVSPLFEKIHCLLAHLPLSMTSKGCIKKLEKLKSL